MLPDHRRPCPGFEVLGCQQWAPLRQSHDVGETMAEPKYTFPEDLFQAQRDFFAAEARVKEICDAMPSSLDVANLEAEITDEQREALQVARAVQVDIVMKLHRHEWWSTVDNRYEAGLELRKAAKAPQ
jgi:hypothetical protein